MLIRKRVPTLSREIETQLNNMKNKITGRDKDTTLTGSLASIKKELFSIDVPELNRLMEKAVSTKDRIIDQKCIVFIGDTGSGKTTLIKALYGCKMC